ncbi:MAG: hypothetical protein J0I80_11515 [Sphingomonas sp.]|nr:hypothetical protein [Sphingomonas sp.]
MMPTPADWIAALLICCLAVELFARLPMRRAVQTMTDCGCQAAHILGSRAVSDHWKEKVMPVYALRMALQTASLAGAFLLLAGMVAAMLLVTAPIAPHVASLLASLDGGVAGSLGAMVYYGARCRLVD